MNSVPIKYKSLLYSIVVHLLLAAALLSAYVNKDSKHEAYALVDLQSICLCAPDALCQSDMKPAPKPEVAKPKTAQKKQIKKQALPTEKKVEEASNTSAKELVALNEVPVTKVQEDPAEELSEKPVETAQADQESEVEFVQQDETLLVQDAATPVATVAEPTLSVEAQYMQDHIALINALIKKNLSYPRLAKKRGLQGKTLVSFTLNTEGEILDVKAIGEISSILKRSAVKTIKKASAGFPHPSEVLALSIPIIYSLR